MVKGWTNIATRNETYDKIRFLSDCFGMKYSKFLAELINNLFECANSLKPDGNGVILYTGERMSLHINVVGKSTIISGTFDGVPDPDYLSIKEECQIVKQKTEKILNSERNEK